MPRPRFTAFILAGGLVVPTAAGAGETAYFADVTDTHVPAAPEVHVMDLEFGDMDGDGDLDAVGAVEWGPNRLYLNDGAGRFTLADGAFSDARNDSEDVQIADFNRDGALDVLIVAEDGEAHEFYLGAGDGSFTESSDQLPVITSEANAVEAGDLDGDGVLEVLIGNNGEEGRNFAWRYDTEAGRFVDVTDAVLPAVNDRTQDLELADIDGDGDLDLAVANERAVPRLLVNEGGVLTEAPDRLGFAMAVISRETHFFDADSDGDVDLAFCNVLPLDGSGGFDPQTRLLINDGSGQFTDETAARLPAHDFSAFDCGAMDVDGDGDMDFLLGAIAAGFEPRKGAAWLNDGSGHFTDASDDVLPDETAGRLWDFEVADLDGDGIEDVFIGGWKTQARLLLGKRSD